MEGRTKKGYATKIDIERVEKRIQKMYGFNQLLIGIKNTTNNLKVENRIMRNEIKALNKRIDKLNKSRGLSGLWVKNE